ncbi:MULTISPECIES: hypothetical protein [Paenibacillus]|jgi:hypothetical protein|uniref:Uncharacterized protein n=2 Tax=Paenibacillus TaxID=44249 RepID=A0AAJ3MH48_PAEPO|nr:MULTISPECIES: hypothetical protein [Paenibacillus]AHC19934.1 hypothetical protein X809_12085 [Paenibacillus polymyxa CR1]ALA42183.1 hypothetical protein ABE82_11870 [Paenibacillus peoriae]APB76092.1 hypothetical protein PPYC2_14490 [Paenibacillus polymyxa]APQ59374.1 hypothetical protein VK72_11785 [Paenibacillus polymyxa]MBP1176205.1 hypothetical protein [Paenibacillus sp. PvR133]
MLYVILVSSILTSLYEFKKFKKKQYVREIVFSSVLLTIGVILIILRIANIELPTPLTGIRILFQPVSRLLIEMLS